MCSHFEDASPRSIQSLGLAGRRSIWNLIHGCVRSYVRYSVIGILGRILLNDEDLPVCWILFPSAATSPQIPRSPRRKSSAWHRVFQPSKSIQEI